MTNPLPEAIQKLLREVVFRKTTYIQPHEYIVREWGEQQDALITCFAALLKTHGYEQKFLDGRTYRYVNLGPYRYWMIKNVLNRSLIGPEPRDRPQS